MDYEVEAQAEHLLAGLRERQAQIQQLQDQARQVTATARSRDGLVSVQVGAQGQLLDLRLDPGAYDRLSPQRLAAAVVELARAAAENAAGQTHEIMAPVLPAEGDLAGGVPPTLSMLRDGTARGLR